MILNIETKKEQPHLRFGLGDKVFLKSDENRKTAMTITRYVLLWDDDESDDYFVSWLNSQGKPEQMSVPDAALTK